MAKTKKFVNTAISYSIMYAKFFEIGHESRSTFVHGLGRRSLLM